MSASIVIAAVMAKAEVDQALHDRKRFIYDVWRMLGKSVDDGTVDLIDSMSGIDRGSK